MARAADSSATASPCPGSDVANAAALPPDAIHPKTRKAWRAWLQRHHDRREGVWLVNYKKATGKPRMEYADVVEEALCYGWIDSQPRALDAERSMLRVAPRKPGTGWSKANKTRVATLSVSGAMAAPGLAKVAAARRDGSWTKLDGVSALELPRDLAAALRGHAGAKAHFDAFPPSVRKSILEWILQAKREETRARRIAETATLAARNERAHQWRR